MIRIGSRGSRLARWQAEWVKGRLEQVGHACRIEVIRTTGDKITGVPLSQVGTKGLFTKEIEEALLTGRIDLAVHSMKDMPTEIPAGLTIGAVPAREDARDALVGAKLTELAADAKIGTSSLRRAAQLRLLRPRLRIEPIRGNLDTRLRKLAAGSYDAIVVAVAGMRRLGWADRITEVLEVDTLCPAAGQGALAVETRAEDRRMADVCRLLEDASTRAAVTAERATLRMLGGGCQVPIGVHGTIDGGELALRAVVISPDGKRVVRGRDRGPLSDAALIGGRLGERLLVEGADEILEEVYGTS